MFVVYAGLRLLAGSVWHSLPGHWITSGMGGSSLPMMLVYQVADISRIFDVWR